MHRAAEDVTDLVQLAERLSSAGSQVRPDDEFRDRLRQRLIAVASVHGINAEPGFRPPPPVDAEPGLLHPLPGSRRRVPRRVTVVSGTLAGLVALSGVGFASSNANPGDALYGVKRSRETAQLTLARSAVARGQLHLEFARNRLAEAAAATRDQRQLDRLLNDMDSDTRLGMNDLGTAAATQHHPAPLDLVDEFALAQHRELSVLANAGTTLPLAAQRIRTSLALVDQISKRSVDLRGVLRCADPLTVDGLGPLPRECVDPPAEETSLPSEEPTTSWPTRPRSNGYNRRSRTPSPEPSESAAGTTAAEDFDPSKAVESMVPQSGSGFPTPMSGSPITPLVGSVHDTIDSVGRSPLGSGNAGPLGSRETD
ncbi:DUF5667 domain-containing protein [Cryptosporangium sp. NPDC048952]|uniref:DUF5667 domain-containing protein n=1 Tax=Cryptosporangium sp. NPDC048952 TaxID=3363961 RepID=UPI00371BB085